LCGKKYYSQQKLQIRKYLHLYVYFLVAHCDFTNTTLTKAGVTLGDMAIVPIAPKDHSFSTSLFK
jgi:hypothetical protein